MSRYMPFLPVFGGGQSKFQPVYVGDLARACEILSRGDKNVNSLVGGKIIQAGGPDGKPSYLLANTTDNFFLVVTYKQIMQQVLEYNGRRRLVLSLPFPLGKLIGMVSERLPQNLFTVTQSQVGTSLHTGEHPSDKLTFVGRAT